MTSTGQHNSEESEGHNYIYQANGIVDDDNSTMIFPRKSLQGLKSFP